jgi:hypothetical protein
VISQKPQEVAQPIPAGALKWETQTANNFAKNTHPILYLSFSSCERGRSKIQQGTGLTQAGSQRQFECRDTRRVA